MKIFGGKESNQRETDNISVSLINDLKLLLQKQLSALYENAQNFDIEFDNEFVYITFVLPTALLYQEEHGKIFKALTQTLYPYFTVLHTTKADIVERKSNNINNARALRYRLLKGKPNQLQVQSVNELIDKRTLKINNQITLDFNDITHVLITGQSGSGKSYTTLMLLKALQMMNKNGYYQNQITIVDPKLSSLAKFAYQNKNDDFIDNLIIPNFDNKNDDDLLSDVNMILDLMCKMMIQRQQKKLENDSAQFTHKWLVIDELIGLQVVANKNMKDTFHNYLSQLLVMGREVNIHVMLISQSFDAKWTPVVAREQANLLIAMGQGNQLRFMFDSDEASEVVIPYEKGGGLMKIIDNKHPANVLPVIFPKIKGDNL